MPFLSPAAGEEEGLREVLARAAEREGPDGVMLIEGETGRIEGALELSVFSARSRLVELSRLMVSPGSRRRGIGSRAVMLACRMAFEQHAMHRVQAEVYGDNVAGLRLFERAGFTREGVRRQAYWRRERWLDGVLFGLLAGELPSRGS